MAGPMRPIRPRRGDEARYYRQIRKVLLDPLLKEVRSGLTQAAAARLAIEQLDNIQWPTGVSVGLVESEIEAQAARLRGYHRERLVETFKTSLGVDIRSVLREPEIDAWMTRWRQVNIDLIRTIPRRLHDDLQRRMTQVFAERPFDRQALGKVLQTEFGSAGYNLRRLTRDQTSKAIGQLTQIRQQQIGVTDYRWRTSEDERVRPTHRENNNKVFSWKNPPSATGHPGSDIQCRCSAIAHLVEGGAPLRSLRDDLPLWGDRPVTTLPQVAQEVGWQLSTRPAMTQEASDAATTRIGSGARVQEGQDVALKRYANQRWGDQRVRIVDGDEFDAIDSPTLWRGVGDQRYVQSNLNGEWVGTGVYGNGNYYGIADDALSYMEQNGWMFRAKLDPNARVLRGREARSAMQQRQEAAYLADDVSEGSKMFNVDMGRFAAQEGYDAMIVGRWDFNVVLNQRAIIIDRRSLPDGEWGRQLLERRAADLAAGNRDIGNRPYFSQLVKRLGDE